jgi:hypothetical protein
MRYVIGTTSEPAGPPDVQNKTWAFSAFLLKFCHSVSVPFKA